MVTRPTGRQRSEPVREFSDKMASRVTMEGRDGRRRATRPRSSFDRVMRRPPLQRVHATFIVFTLVAGFTVALIRIDPQGRADAKRRTSAAPVLPKAVTPPPKAADGARSATKSSGLSAPIEGRRYRGTYQSIPKYRFADLFPAQAAATSDPSVPVSNHWALVIGINDYWGGTRDNIGSWQDARDLRRHLMNLGWRGDHIVLLANRQATASMILQSIRWLASKTGGASTVVFNYSGHEEPRNYGGSRHIMLHASDNRMIADTAIAAELGRVRAQKMWINLAVCRAGGFNQPGLVKPGRVVTFSSPESELSYEDPTVDHSVFGWFLIMEGMVSRMADYNDDGNVVVEEAFRYAKPDVTNRTSGMQHPFMIDKLSGYFSLKPPAPATPPASSGSDSDGCAYVICGGSASTAAARRD